MMEFVRFREANNYEGETWNFWLQVDGNEDELDKLAALIQKFEATDPDLPYQIWRNGPVDEHVVDALCELAYEDAEINGRYAPEHQKVTGKFTCPDSIGEYGDDLYKGGILEFFSGV